MRWDSCGLRWAPWAAVLTVILCKSWRCQEGKKSIRPFTRCSAGTGQGPPQARPQTPEPRRGGCCNPGSSRGYYTGGPLASKHPASLCPPGTESPWRAHSPPTPAGFWNTGPLAWQGGPPRTDLRPGHLQPSSRPRLGGPLALGSPGKAAWLQWALAGAEVGAGRGACRSPPSPLAPSAPHRCRLPGSPESGGSAGCQRTGAG